MIKFSILFFFVFSWQTSSAQLFGTENYTVTRFGMEDGLPQSTVNDIIQTTDGYIWLATNGGLVRFDGNSFTNFDRSNTPSMQLDRIIKLFEDQQGVLWVSTENGLISVKEGNFRTHIFKDFNRPVPPNDIKEDKNGGIWAKLSDSFYKLKDPLFIEVPVIRDPEQRKNALQNDSGIWLAKNREVYKTLGDSAVLVLDLTDEVGSELISAREFPEGSGILFIGTQFDGIIRYEKGELTRYTSENGLPTNNFISSYLDQKDRLFASVFGGLGIWNGTNFEKVVAFESRESIILKSILEDSEGNYWVGTAANGLYRLTRSIIEMIDLEDGLSNDKMLALLQLKDGSALFSTNCGGVYHWKNGEIEKPKSDFISDNGCFWSLYEDSKGQLWFGARGVYVTKSLDEPGTFLGIEDGFTNAEVFAITEDHNGDMWIASSDFLAVYNDGIIKKYSEEDGLFYNDVRVLFEDEDGVMWVGTGAGLNKIKDDQVYKIDLLSSANKKSDAPIPQVRAIYKDESGVMWIGTYGAGIFRIENGEIDNITTTQGLFDDIVSHLVEDENGNLWMGSNRGISYVKKTDLNAVIEGEINEVNAYSYGAFDGMNSPETNGGFQPSTIKDSLGKIYFPTVAGVAVVNSRMVSRNEIRPPVYLESIKSNEEEFPISEPITLPYNTAYLDFKYTAISFTDPERVEFKYRMKGLDDDWIEVGSQRSALYSKIPPGEYEFQVAASNNDGLWNYDGASVFITVIPPFWERTWFYVLVGLILLVTGPSVYYRRVKKLKMDNERQKRFSEQLIESQESERRRIATELHDGLGQQILVIKNRAELAQKQVQNPTVMAGQLKEIMQSAVSSIADVRNITHNLRPIHLEKFGLTEAITNLCDELQRTSIIDWSYYIDDIDGLIPKEKEINFYRVIQEGINNILKHSEAEQASIIIKKTDTLLTVKMWDDGKGFNTKLIDSISGLGFLGMKERMESLSGKLEIKSDIGQETIIEIFIPLKKNGQ